MTMKYLLSTLFLLLASLSTTTANEGPPCNSVIGKVSVTEIQTVIGGLLQFNLNLENGWNQTQLLQALPVYLGTAVYDVLASKVCGSCQDVVDNAMDNDEASAAASTFCGQDVYGANATHSALVFHPLDPVTGDPLPGTRNGLVSFQSTRFETRWAYSTHFPSNVTERILTTVAQGNFLDFFTSFVDTVPMLLAASSGLIAIGPDYIGTGASIDYDRSYLTAMPVQQAAAVSWKAAEKYTQDATNGCTALGTQAVTTGYSAGGASVVFGTIALESAVGVNIVRMFTQAAPYSNSFVAQGVIATMLLAPDNFTFVGPQVTVWTSYAASYSNEAPFLQNTGTGQTILAPDYINPVNDSSKDVLSWYFDEKVSAAEIQFLYPTDKVGFLDTVHPAVLAAVIESLAVNGTLWCQPEFQTNQTNAICAALELNSPYLSWDLATNYPIEWCHSTEDALVPFFLTEFFLLPFQKPNVVQYQAVFEFMEPFGDHGEAHIACNAALPTFLLMDDTAAELLAVVPVEEGACTPPSPQPTGMPTTIAMTFEPTMAPTPMEDSDAPTREPVVDTTDDPTEAPSSSWAIRPATFVSGIAAMIIMTSTLSL